MFAFGLFTQVSESGPQGPLVNYAEWSSDAVHMTVPSRARLQHINGISTKTIPRKIKVIEIGGYVHFILRWLFVVNT